MSNPTPTESFIATTSMVAAVASIGIVTLLGLVALKTQTISCRLQYVTCPKEVLTATGELLGTSWLSTNVQRSLAAHDLTVVDLRRSFPGHLELSLAYAQTTQSPQVEPTDRAASLLSQTGIDHTSITKASDAALVVTLTDGKTALIDPYDIELSVHRLKTILEGTDFASLDTKIIEIDTRFKLPVLRTTLSFPQPASASSSTSEEINS